MTDTDLTPAVEIPPPPPPGPPAKPRRQWLRLCWRVLRSTLLLLLILFMLLCGGVLWLLGSHSGFAWLMAEMGVLSGQLVSVQHSQGNLWDGFTLSELRVRTAAADVDIDSLKFSWQPQALWQRELWVRQLKAGHVKVRTKPTPPTPDTGAPQSLSLPLHLRIDQLAIASLQLVSEDITLYKLAASYRYDGEQHQLRLSRLGSPWGQANLRLNLAAASPFALSGELKARGELDEIPVQAQLSLSGSLLKLGVSGQLGGKGLLADIKGELLPFASNPFNSFTRLDVRVGGINPQALQEDWPKGKLNLAVFAEPDGHQGVSGGLTLTNEVPGPLSQHKLPLSLLVAQFRGDEKSLQLFNTKAQLAGGELDVSGELKPSGMRLVLDIRRLALQQLHASAPDDRLSGRIQLDGPFARPNVEAELNGRVLQAKTSLAFAPEPNSALLIKQLELSAGAGKLALTGQLGLAGTQAFSVNGSLLRADPARFQPGLPAGDLNASLQAKGQLNGPLTVGVKLQFGPSRLSGAPLSGNLDLQLLGERLQSLTADLRLAQNRLQAQGSYGRAGDRLRLNIDAPNLSLLGPSFAGVIKGQGELSGTPQVPVLTAQLQAEKLRLPGDIAVRSMQFSGNVKADQNSPFQLQLDIDALKAGDLRARQLRASAQGTRSKHSLQLEGNFRVAENPYQLQLAADGGLRSDSGVWSGVLQRLALQGKPSLLLQAPVALELGSERIKVGAAQLNALGGQISLTELVRQANGVLSTRGEARGLQLAQLAPFFTLPVQQNLVLDADWNLDLAAQAKGQLRLRRASGDIQLPGDKGHTTALGLKSAMVSASLEGKRLLFDASIESRFAQLQGKGSLPWEGGNINLKTPLEARLMLNAPSLEAVSALAGPSLDIAGQISADVSLSGPLGQPQAQGSIRGDKLLFADRRTGVRLADGSLQARLEGRQLLMDKLSFKGGEGTVQASGSLDLHNERPDARIKVVLDKFGVFDRPNRRLVVSGQAEVAMLNGELSLSGRIAADQGRIGLPKAGAPTLSDDVVIVGRAEPAPSAFSSMPLHVDLELDLGKRFRFSGQGLEVDLTGSVRVTASPGAAPAARGQVRVVRGRYRAYGQDLIISYGAITFNGPLDNPSLNVRAKRRLSPVGAGVEVSGTVAAPQVRLIADEPMSDKDKLAWLVLGRQASGERDNNDMAASAGAFLAGSLNDQIGLFDDLGVTSRRERTMADGTVSPAEQVVTVGRQLTREIYLGYEYGVSSAEQAVKMIYRLSKGWSVVLRAGNTQSLESRYTLRFD
ncbi:translocation/assembly module TamB domain-containing protein [Neisseriaceae bacterium TC5R-5]|nr:translocation/assembly module TamB domain-containing protein [Neisseriaceae bacterium TC5R-5]